MWMLPTCGRTNRCQEALNSIGAAGPSSGVVWADPSTGFLECPAGWTRLDRPPGLSLNEAANAFFERFPNEPWYGVISDDSIVRTEGWSGRLVEAAGSAGFANSADGWQADRRMHGAAVIGGDLVRAFGFLSPPGMKHCFSDDALERLGKTLGNWVHVPDIMVEHRHMWNSEVGADPTYQKNYSTFEADKIGFEAWMRDGFAGAVERARPVVEAARPRVAAPAPSQAIGIPKPPAEIVEAALRVARIPARKDSGAEAREARAKSRSVMIASPIARDVTPQYVVSLLKTVNLLNNYGVRFGAEFIVGSSNLPRSRNALVARFLASDYSDLIMIDDDMGWDAGSVIRLLASDKPFLAAAGRKKTVVANSDPNAWCAQFIDGASIEHDAMGAIRVRRVGGAFVKYERSVFERLIAAHPEWKIEGHEDMTEAQRAAYHQFFRFDTESHDEIGEDYLFCDRWREAGGEIWVDPSIELTHMGAYPYTGRLIEILQPVAPPDVLARMNASQDAA